MIGYSISIFASIGRLPIELWLLQCCLKQPPIIDSSTKFENRPFADKKLAQVPYSHPPTYCSTPAYCLPCPEVMNRGP